MALSEVQYAVISQTGTATLVAAQGAGVKIRVVSLFLTNTSAQTLTFKSGAAGAAISGPMAMGALGQIVLPFASRGYFETAAAAVLELFQSGATQVSGAVQWVAVS